MFYLHTHTLVCVGVCVIISDYFLCSLRLCFLQCRLAFAYLSTYGGNLSSKERAYITISGFPKATVQVSCTVPCRTRGHGYSVKLFIFVFRFYFFLVSLWLDSFWPDIIWVMCVVFPECLSRSRWLACRVCGSCCTVARWVRWVALGCHGGLHFLLLTIVCSRTEFHCVASVCECSTYVCVCACVDGCLCHVVYALLLRCQTAVAPNVNVTLLWLTFASEPSERTSRQRDRRKRGNLLLLTLFNMRLISSGELTTHEILQQAFLTSIPLSPSLSFFRSHSNMRSACCIFHCQPFL